jgi:hypothetical protein
MKNYIKYITTGLLLIPLMAFGHGIPSSEGHQHNPSTHGKHFPIPQHHPEEHRHEPFPRGGYDHSDGRYWPHPWHRHHEGYEWPVYLETYEGNIIMIFDSWESCEISRPSLEIINNLSLFCTNY